MKRNLMRMLPGLFLLAVLLGIAPSTPAGQCSLSGTAGKYGFTLTGLVITQAGAIPIAAVGRANLDASGSATGVESRSVGGSFADETFSGTYTVNSDCTGTATLHFFESGQLVRTSVLSIVLDNNEKEIRMLQKSLTLPNGVALPVVITVEARKIFTEDD